MMNGRNFSSCSNPLSWRRTRKVCHSAALMSHYRIPSLKNASFFLSSFCTGAPGSLQKIVQENLFQSGWGLNRSASIKSAVNVIFVLSYNKSSALQVKFVTHFKEGLEVGHQVPLLVVVGEMMVSNWSSSLVQVSHYSFVIDVSSSFKIHG